MDGWIDGRMGERMNEQMNKGIVEWRGDQRCEGRACDVVWSCVRNAEQDHYLLMSTRVHPNK
eukprot:1157108-Pelagomonas_calceolata.AAC.6